jgi:hypothetical protein
LDLDEGAIAQLVQQLLGTPTDTAAVRLYLGGQEELPALDVERFSKMPAVLEKTREYLRWMHTYWETMARLSPDLNLTASTEALVVSRPGSTIVQLPNARAGVEYESPALPGVTDLILFDLADDTGLTYDSVASAVRGTPQAPGEFKWRAQWRNLEGRIVTGHCALLVVPDPKTLWKKLEPPSDLPYRKPNEERLLLAGNGLKVAAASRRGRSHEHVGAFRDDDFSVRHDSGSGWLSIAVADGAGSARNSREGSRIAVQRFSEDVLAELSGKAGSDIQGWLGGWESAPETRKQIGERFHQVFLAAAGAAVSAIEEVAKVDQLPVREYSTTLLAAAVRRDGEHTFVASFWIGDGAIAAYLEAGSVRVLGTPDSGEYAGQTKFLDRAALSELAFAKRVSVGRFKQLHSLLLMTDGVSDPRFETDAGLAEPERWDSLVCDLSSSLSSDVPDAALLSWLEFFTPGHHDDRTVAVLW